MNIGKVRDLFAAALEGEQFVTDKSGVKTIEIIGSSFIVDQNTIFGEPNDDYIRRELEWYDSQSLNVNDFPGGAPTIWKQVADPEGFINSNYGFLLFSNENGNQYKNVLEELSRNPLSRRAVAVYTRPSIWTDYNKNGMSDYICTNAVQYVIRDGTLDAVVQMRSGDSVYGFKNDRAWAQHVLDKLAKDLNVPAGYITWQVGSLHVYERHFYLVDHYNKTGEHKISKKKYADLYPESIWIN